MALDELQERKVKKVLEKLCSERIPEKVRDQIKLEFNIRGNNVTLFEKRRYYKDPKEWTKQKIAQFRYDQENNLWSLYWWRHTQKWYKYEEIGPSKNLKELVKEVDEDPTGIFWG
ncbi:DUF3024 domain-containing protein [Fuchsiella alkaliacetigena]|uniref:DUF3024 domain-containing protein n=1 Tax=Fuchsiella alkaliacetigena TaxID=957042 RepID=UPI00200B0602|nr:DUF3024 domain-containing protein [Fuchsiella alkaliacetigena]MCK8825787.1 DUF3024 domain-containing protein [Fuchsiella alkaliacetigena]